MGYVFPLNISLITGLPSIGADTMKFSCELLLSYNPGRL